MAGYLSLHQTASSLIIKWTPNQLMNCHSPGANQNDHPEIDASDKRLDLRVGSFILILYEIKLLRYIISLFLFVVDF